MSREFTPISNQLRQFSREITRKINQGKFPPPSEFMRTVCKVCHGSGFARYFRYGRWGVKRCDGWQPIAQYADDNTTQEPRRSQCFGADYEAWVSVNRHNLLLAIQRLLCDTSSVEYAERVCAELANQMFDTSNITLLTCDQLELLFYKLSCLTLDDTQAYNRTQNQPEQMSAGSTQEHVSIQQADDIYCF